MSTEEKKALMSKMQSEFATAFLKVLNDNEEAALKNGVYVDEACSWAGSGIAAGLKFFLEHAEEPESPDEIVAWLNRLLAQFVGGYDARIEFLKKLAAKTVVGTHTEN